VTEDAQKMLIWGLAALILEVAGVKIQAACADIKNHVLCDKTFILLLNYLTLVLFIRYIEALWCPIFPLYIMVQVGLPIITLTRNNKRKVPVGINPLRKKRLSH